MIDPVVLSGAGAAWWTTARDDPCRWWVDSTVTSTGAILASYQVVTT